MATIVSPQHFSPVEDAENIKKACQGSYSFFFDYSDSSFVYYSPHLLSWVCRMGNRWKGHHLDPRTPKLVPEETHKTSLPGDIPRGSHSPAQIWALWRLWGLAFIHLLCSFPLNFTKRDSHGFGTPAESYMLVGFGSSRERCSLG